MTQLIKAEWLKEKRSTNKKLFLIVPLIFISFSLVMTIFMGTQANGHSFLVTTAYNWYPLMILPLFISILSGNNLLKEKKHKNDLFYRTLDISIGKLYLAKLLIVTLEVGIILLISFLAIVAIGKGQLHDPLDYTRVLWATLYLFIGSLPLIPLSFLIYQFSNYFIVILINFIFSLLGAMVAIESWWVIFPWSYTLRAMAAALGIHPNGTLLESGSYLLDTHAIILVCGLGIGLFTLFSGVVYLLLERREQYA